MDKDGRMTLQEFTIAVHLIESKLRGLDIPKMLPPTLKQSTDPNFRSSQPQPFVPNGMPPNMGILQPNMGMKPPNMGMNGGIGMGFSGQHQQLNRSATVQPQGSRMAPVQNNNNNGLLKQSSFDTLQLGGGTNAPVYNYSKTLPINKSAFDSLALDKLTNLGAGSLGGVGGGGGGASGGGGILKLGDISSPVRLRYTQMFKAADMSKTGLLTGEQARNVLLQTGVNPNMLVQIW